MPADGSDSAGMVSLQSEPAAPARRGLGRFRESGRTLQAG
jgi:hypothetical protein